MNDMWIAHDEPEKPLAFGAWVCDCPRCEIALRATLNTNPTLMFVIKRCMGRDRVSVGDILANGVDSYVDGPDDYVREVFVAS